MVRQQVYVMMEQLRLVLILNNCQLPVSVVLTVILPKYKIPFTSYPLCDKDIN